MRSRWSSPRARAAANAYPASQTPVSSEKSRPNPSRAGSAVRELRQQAREEDGHLRVREIAEQPLAERAARRRSRRGRRLRLPSPECREQRLQPEVDEVGGADEAERREGGLGCPQDRDEPCGGRDRPDGLSERDPERGGEPAAPPAGERVLDRQGGVLPGSADDDGGDDQESSQLGHAKSIRLPSWRPGSPARAFSSPVRRAGSAQRARGRSRPRARASPSTTTAARSARTRWPPSSTRRCSRPT